MIETAHSPDRVAQHLAAAGRLIAEAAMQPEATAAQLIRHAFALVERVGFGKQGSI